MGHSPSDGTFQPYYFRVNASCAVLRRAGDHFTLESELLCLPPKQESSVYSLISLCRFLLQNRAIHPNDWVSADAVIARSDSNCKSRFQTDDFMGLHQSMTPR
ncbi:hypothetical protein BD779DRAFT_1446016 [Infundibulicybe gibba]|nr:hypothetical protein BD779DRAFT_1446016 [Infundibulicybe gibba]